MVRKWKRYTCLTGYNFPILPIIYLCLNSSWLETHVLYAFFSNSYARPVCLSSHSFIFPSIIRDYAKPYVQACLCYAGLDTSFFSSKDKRGVLCKLLCLGSSPVCWREKAHSHMSLNTQDKDCMVTCSVHTFQTLTYDWNTNETCWKNKGFSDHQVIFHQLQLVKAN